MILKEIEMVKFYLLWRFYVSFVIEGFFKGLIAFFRLQIYYDVGHFFKGIFRK